MIERQGKLSGFFSSESFQETKGRPFLNGPQDPSVARPAKRA
jgi:hypothetical protein